MYMPIYSVIIALYVLGVQKLVSQWNQDVVIDNKIEYPKQKCSDRKYKQTRPNECQKSNARNYTFIPPIDVTNPINSLFLFIYFNKG